MTYFHKKRDRHANDTTQDKNVYILLKLISQRNRNKQQQQKMGEGIGNLYLYNQPPIILWLRNGNISMLAQGITWNMKQNPLVHDDIIKWKHFPRYWLFVRGIHRSPVNSPHKGQLREALMFSLMWAWTNGWANNRDAGGLRRHLAHYDVTVMLHQVMKFHRWKTSARLRFTIWLAARHWHRSQFLLNITSAG